MAHRSGILEALIAACACIGATAATANAYVYWTNVGPTGNGGTTIGRANLDASGVTHHLVSTAGTPSGITLAGGQIYWSNSATNSIGRANLNGTGAAPTFIPNATVGAIEPNALTSDGTYLYWSDQRRYIGRARLDGTGVAPHFIDAGSGSMPSGVAVTGGNLYLSEASEIDAVPVTGGTASLFAGIGADTIPTSLTYAGGFLYFSEIDTTRSGNIGSIGRISTSATGLNTDYIPNLQFPTGVAGDSTHLYWVDHDTNQIGRALIGSVGATNIENDFASEPDGPIGVAVDGLTDPTQTQLVCTPAIVSIGKPSGCTATVTTPTSTARPTGQSCSPATAAPSSRARRRPARSRSTRAVA